MEKYESTLIQRQIEEVVTNGRGYPERDQMRYASFLLREQMEEKAEGFRLFCESLETNDLPSLLRLKMDADKIPLQKIWIDAQGRLQTTIDSKLFDYELFKLPLKIDQFKSFPDKFYSKSTLDELFPRPEEIDKINIDLFYDSERFTQKPVLSWGEYMSRFGNIITPDCKQK